MANNTTETHDLKIRTELSTTETGGQKAAQTYQNVADSLQQLSTRAQPAKTWLDTLGATIANTFRYQVVNKFTDALFEGSQKLLNI